MSSQQKIIVFLKILFILFLYSIFPILKIYGVVDYSWWLILSPIIVPVLIVIILLLWLVGWEIFNEIKLNEEEARFAGYATVLFVGFYLASKDLSILIIYFLDLLF